MTLVFSGMEFGEEGTDQIEICGSTPLEKNTVLLKFSGEGQEQCRMLEFTGESLTQKFRIEPVRGTVDVSFVFLPGSNFNFHWFRFYKTLFIEGETRIFSLT